MDSVQGPAPKRLKDRTFFRAIPGEIRNELYRCAALPAGVEPEQHTFKTVTGDSTIAPLDTIKSFFVDTISADGKSVLFAKDIVQVTELTEEILTLVMPLILFKFNTVAALETFVETFAAHLSVCKVVPELHIELCFTKDMGENEVAMLGSWAECKLPHGRDINMHDHVQRWMEANQSLPGNTIIHFVFPQIWRDFRELRGLSKKFGVSKRTITFQFPTPSSEIPEYSFYIAQTMAAVKDIEVPEQVGISSDKRVKLAKLGCRGFNGNGQRLID
ncbi:hypothetical protein G7Y89_g13776 [Cudoniella acicularis]|uniref:Uncharacterized protein n=1 Tax=Cudoniella acicularis TaxID=354080 RepID=A0A8H4R8M8_9HELO|nr:hypothetical protein G7Y89_g13776 [Cudoniella acicularis]